MSDLPPEVESELRCAVDILEYPGVVARSLAAAGRPVDTLLGGITRLAGRDVRSWVDSGLLKCLEAAMGSLETWSPMTRSRWLSTIVTGTAGGIAGFFGPIAMPVELPVTTTLMMRAIGAVALEAGEDMTRVETWLACMDVFALGTSETGGYYATRTAIAPVDDGEAEIHLNEQIGNASTLVMTRVTAEVLGRITLVLTELSSSTAVPVVGAFTGTSVNMIFTDHFQRIARGHFTVRRLERRHGAEPIKRLYQRIAADETARRSRRGWLRRLVFA